MSSSSDDDELAELRRERAARLGSAGLTVVRTQRYVPAVHAV